MQPRSGNRRISDFFNQTKANEMEELQHIETTNELRIMTINTQSKLLNNIYDITDECECLGIDICFITKTGLTDPTI